MNTQLQRVVSFAPEEISSLVNDDVVAQHAEEAAFLWTLRNRAVGEPHYTLQQLDALDERVEAHLQGLVVATDAGWSQCQSRLSLDEPGAVFAAGILAFRDGDRARMLEVLRAGCATPVALPGLVSSLAWLEREQVHPWIQRLLEAAAPIHRTVGIAASALHRVDPGAVLAKSLDDPDPGLRARALRAVGELKRDDLLGLVRRHLEDEEDSCRFWAAWSLTLHGEREGLANLVKAIDTPTHGVRAMQLALRAMTLDESRNWISASTANARLAVMATGVVGDPAAIPWLIKKMEDPSTARLAGEAFSNITGVDIDYNDLDMDRVDDLDEVEDGAEDTGLSLGYESNLPTPSPDLVAEWWRRNHASFAAKTRYLCGKPVSVESAYHALLAGTQRQRAGAALELSILEPGTTLFEVRGRATRQMEQLRARV